MNDNITATIPILPESSGKKNSATPELDRLVVKPQGRYKFIRSIGFGGMKGVLLVYDRDTERELAMAIIPDFRDRPKSDLERFVREARVTAKLEHPNIVSVHDIGIDQSGSPYFTMQYLHGMTLDNLLKRLAASDPQVEKYTLSRLLLIFLRVCNAVDFAHSRGICHLDLKPANVHIGDFGEVQVIDWGLARDTDFSGRVIGPRDENNRGTPGFIPPEMLDPEHRRALDIRADVFALGALLYSMLALKTPLAGLPVDDILRRTIQGRIPPPSKVAPEGRIVPESLEAVAMKALSPDPDDRYSDVAEIKAEIRAFNSGFASQAEH
ncbi:MAG: serine/threonine protein kinase, partial [Victivallaceae bacterium]|nr:serine/threonine protein kinase [Victivallaceae bacterium]